MKQFTAIIAALLITGVIGSAMFIVGGSALANKNTAPMLNSLSQANTTNVSTSSSDPTQAQVQSQSQADAQNLANAQNEINQLQTSLTQYQDRLNQAIQQINTDNTQLAQYQAEFQQVQNLLTQMQQMGLITIDSNGQIFIGSGRVNH
jgi:septal ring factor EnvC (AmiA/AmiB activator)